MAGFSSVTGQEAIMFADNVSFDGTSRGGAINEDGQLLIGDDTAPHIKKGTLTSTTLSIGYSSPNITVNTAGGGAPIETITGDDLVAVVPTSGNVNIRGGTTGLTFSGAGSTLTLNSPELNLPNTTTSAIGVVNINGNRFMHKFGDADNVFVGTNAGNFTNTTALANTGVGSGALTALTTGDNNTAVGNLALNAATTTSGAVAIGQNALAACQSGFASTVAIGTNAVKSYVSGTTTGGVFIGNNAAQNWTGSTNSTNVVIGTNACQTGIGTTATAGNVLIGGQVTPNLTTGVGNVILGGRNISQSNSAFFGLTTGSFNVGIGYGSGAFCSASDSSNIYLNLANVNIQESNTCRIGTGTGTGQQQLSSTFIHGINGVTSSNPLMVTINSSTSQLGVAAVPVTSTAWSVITANQTAAVNNGYICNKAGTLALALPSTAAVGSIIEVTGINTALGWQITQASGQQIFFGTSSTTSGATGTLTSSATRDAIKILCVVADTTWQVLSSIGNITIV